MHVIRYHRGVIMKKFVFAAIAAASLTSVAPSVGAGVPTSYGQKLITRCKDFSGVSFYQKHGLVGIEDAYKWEKDGVSSGSIVLIHNGGDDYNILLKDASGATTDYKADGKAIIIRPAPLKFGLYSILAVDSYMIETFLFQITGNGDGNVAWTLTKANANFAKVSAFSAKCSLAN